MNRIIDVSMPDIPGFVMHRQDGSLSCWVAAARSVLDFYAGAPGGHDETTQKELVSLFSTGGKASGDPDTVLLAAGALRNSEKFNGDDAALGQVPRIFLRIKDSVTRGEPIVVSLRQAASKHVGHAVVIYGYDPDRTLHMGDPARPSIPISAKLDDVMLNFAPYPEVEFSSMRYYCEKLSFTQQPPAWRARRVQLPGLYSGFYSK